MHLKINIRAWILSDYLVDCYKIGAEKVWFVRKK